MKLIIGNKNYSSWSLRPWLMLKVFGIDFVEQQISLFSEGYKQSLLSINPAGTVPYLIDDDVEVADSLAICEYLNETYLQGAAWPKQIQARAQARSVCAEMHSGFFAIRNQLPMNCRASNRRVTQTEELQHEITRVDQLWRALLSQYSERGPWLFGEFSIADCFYAPVALRFNTYGCHLSDESLEYVKRILQHPDIQQWMDSAKQEEAVIEMAELGV